MRILARIMHKFLTVVPKRSALTARSEAGAPEPQAGAPGLLVRTAFSMPRYKNLCITRARQMFIAVALCVAFLGCSKEVVMPESLIGVWRTADKKYADRHFELRAERVIFSTGGWGVTAHPIYRMEEHSENGRTFYIIYYPPNGEGGESQFSFYYDPVQQVIRFKNQEQMVWVKWVEETTDDEAMDDEELPLHTPQPQPGQ